jgi:hypothetical protein
VSSELHVQRLLLCFMARMIGAVGRIGPPSNCPEHQDAPDELDDTIDCICPCSVALLPDTIAAAAVIFQYRVVNLAWRAFQGERYRTK